MKRGPSKPFDGLIDTNRRGLLKALTVGSITSIAMPGMATASGGEEITIRQGGQEVATVSPVSTDRSIENFYRYDEIEGASANTPMNLRESNTSKLFFYRRSGSDTPLSLVIIHDTPHDGNGGDVRFDFQPNALPSGGSWAVQDDPGEGFSRTQADWWWAPCCTDGGAYRGGFSEGTEVTIDPLFNEGIGQWDLLDSDGSVAADLSLTDPVTVTVGSAGKSVDVGTLVDEKLTLAERVTDASLGVNDVKIAKDALDTLTGNYSSGAISESTAKEAIRRLKLAENVSETALVAPGPTDVITPEVDRTFVGADRNQSYNLVNRFANLLVQLCAITSVLGGAIAGSAAAALGGAAVAASNELYAAVKGLLGGISFGINSIADLFDSDTLEAFGELLKSSSDPENALASDLLAPAKQKIRTGARTMMEKEYSGSIAPVIKQFADEVAGEDASSGDPEPGFKGSSDAAKTSSERGVQRIEELVANEIEDIEQTNLFTGILDVAAGFAALGSVLFGITSLVALIIAGVSTIMKAMQTLDTFATFSDIVEKHRFAVDGVRQGEVTIDAQ